MEKLISIDLKADFGFLRKPDTNEGISMSYNMLHKPGLLGVFGAILGMEGYQRRGELPEYYQKLHNLQIGIAPIDHQNSNETTTGNFAKTTIVYTNTVGYANKDKNSDPATFVAYENTLVRPSYRIFVILSESDPLYQCLRKSEAEYLPYLGKNEFPLWWDNFQEYELKPFPLDQEFEVKSLFIKKDQIRGKENGSGEKGSIDFLLNSNNPPFFLFERLPLDFQEFETDRGMEYQYRLIPFTYTNAKFPKDLDMDNLYEIAPGEVVQLN